MIQQGFSKLEVLNSWSYSELSPESTLAPSAQTTPPRGHFRVSHNTTMTSSWQIPYLPRPQGASPGASLAIMWAHEWKCHFSAFVTPLNQCPLFRRITPTPKPLNHVPSSGAPVFEPTHPLGLSSVCSSRFRVFSLPSEKPFQARVWHYVVWGSGLKVWDSALVVCFGDWG